MEKTLITDRLMPRIIADICRAHGITCESFSDNWILRLEKDGSTRWIVGSQFDINHSAGSEIARDKVATYVALSRADVPAIAHVLARTRGYERILTENLSSFDADQPVVAKPLFGNAGIGIKKFSSLDTATAYISAQTEPSWALSPWYDIDTETRIIVLDGRVLHAYKKTAPQTIDGLKFFNLSHGSEAIDISPTTSQTTLALNAQKACGLRLCAVDIVSLASGEDMVMEINDHFGVEYYARSSDEHYQKTYALYDEIVTAMMLSDSKN